MITMHIQHRDYPKDELGYTSFNRYNIISDDDYYIEKESHSLISIRKNNGEKKYIKVVEDVRGEYTYKVQKTQVKAINGADGLWGFIEDSRKERSPFVFMAESLIESIYNKVKAAKVGGNL